MNVVSEAKAEVAVEAEEDGSQEEDFQLYALHYLQLEFLKPGRLANRGRRPRTPCGSPKGL